LDFESAFHCRTYFFYQKQTGWSVFNKMEEEQLKQKKSWKTIVIVAVIVGVAAIGIYMWTSGDKYESTENAQLDGDIVSMRSAVTANLEKIYFVDNQTVKKGDTLMRFEITSLEAKVKMAEAALNDATAQTKVSAGRAAASFENATASQEMAQSNAENIKAAQASVSKASEEFERTKKLLDIRAATQQQFEAVRAQLEVAKAEYAGGRQPAALIAEFCARTTRGGPVRKGADWYGDSPGRAAESGIGAGPGRYETCLYSCPTYGNCHQAFRPGRKLCVRGAKPVLGG
jgi:hypothetical protein